MNESLEYIESYFQKQLPEADMRQFELRCEQDNQFAQDVALYITTREAMKQALADQKKEQWRLLSRESETKVVSAPVRTLFVRRWLPYAAAACLMFFVSIYYFSDQRRLNNQVEAYIKEGARSMLSPPMGAPEDSLELGKQALTLKDYKKSENIFSAYYQSHKTLPDAVFYLGYVFLQQKNYDSALVYFKVLSGMDPYSNYGPYYRALTLLERNKKGDKEEARNILQTVITTDHYDGKVEAKRLLELMK